MKKFLLLVLIATGHITYSQYYNFQFYTEVYDTITGGVKLTKNSNRQYSYQLNNSFNYFGYQMNKQIAIGEKGFVHMMGSTRSVAFDVAQADFLETGFNSGVFVKMDTLNGEEILKVEWRNLRLAGHDTNDHANFMAYMFLKSEVLEFRYGDIKATSTSAFSGAPSPFVFLSVLNGANIDEYYIPVGNASNPTLVYNQPQGFTGLNNIPSKGMVYRFEPVNISLQENRLHDLKVYPSPATDQIYAEHSGEYKIIDNSGRIISSGHTDGTIRIDELSAGHYVLLLSAEGALRSKTRFIKK